LLVVCVSFFALPPQPASTRATASTGRTNTISRKRKRDMCYLQKKGNQGERKPRPALAGRVDSSIRYLSAGLRFNLQLARVGIRSAFDLHRNPVSTAGAVADGLMPGHQPVLPGRCQLDLELA